MALTEEERARQVEYRSSPNGRAALARYQSGAKRLAAQARYRASDTGRLAQRRGQAAARARDPEKAAARHAVRNAVQAGRLIKGACAICGTTTDVDGHHHKGYAREHWLEVLWLCALHHRETHRSFDADPAIREKEVATA